jgi:hypothetical protein
MSAALETSAKRDALTIARAGHGDDIFVPSFSTKVTERLQDATSQIRSHSTMNPQLGW